jgi:hypothetical protein
MDGRNESTSIHPWAASQLADPVRLRHIRADLPIYLFSGSEDPVGQQLERVRVLIERYRNAGIRNISYDFIPVDHTKCCTRSTAIKYRQIYFVGCLRFSIGLLRDAGPLLEIRARLGQISIHQPRF